jgi:hypothetical protein
MEFCEFRFVFVGLQTVKFNFEELINFNYTFDKVNQLIHSII